MTNANSPIGVFDSGLGGITVLKALMQKFPEEQFIYLGDTARIPYGSKSPSTIARYTEKNIQFLLDRGVKAVVVACNSASSVLSQLSFTAPVYNVIEPGARRAAMATSNKKIGIIGTRATVLQKAYVKALEQIDTSIEVFQQSCPLLVPLVEEGWDDDPITNLVVFRYLSPLLAVKIDTLIMGCTHYPVLSNAFRKVVGPHVQLIDSAEVLAAQLEKDFSTGRLPSRTQDAGHPLHLLATDVSDSFQALAARIMHPLPVPALEIVDIR